MSKLMSLAVTTTAYKLTKTTTGVKCDVCGKNIPVKERQWNDDSDRYYEITTGHNDWGNDSCESRKTIDVCPECAPTYIADYLKKNVSSDTAYLEIESKTVWGEQSSEIVDVPPKEDETVEKHHDYF